MAKRSSHERFLSGLKRASEAGARPREVSIAPLELGGAKSRLGRILDQVRAGKREVTIDADGYTSEQVSRIISEAKSRGLDVSGTGRWLLIRDLSGLKQTELSHPKTSGESISRLISETVKRIRSRMNDGTSREDAVREVLSRSTLGPASVKLVMSQLSESASVSHAELMRDPRAALKQRAAIALGWSLADVNSLSLSALRENLRGRAPALVEEIDELIRSGEVIRGPRRVPVAKAGVASKLLFDTPTGAPSAEDYARIDREHALRQSPYSVLYLTPSGTEIEKHLTKQEARRRAEELWREQGVDARAEENGVTFWYSPADITLANFTDVAARVAENVVEHAGRRAAVMSQAAIEAVASRDWVRTLVLKAAQQFEKNETFRGRVSKPDGRGVNYLEEKMRVWLPDLLGTSFAGVSTI